MNFGSETFKVGTIDYIITTSFLVWESICWKCVVCFVVLERTWQLSSKSMEVVVRWGREVCVGNLLGVSVVDLGDWPRNNWQQRRSKGRRKEARVADEEQRIRWTDRQAQGWKDAGCRLQTKSSKSDASKGNGRKEVRRQAVGIPKSSKWDSKDRHQEGLKAGMQDAEEQTIRSLSASSDWSGY